ncbi:uncharacterized protein LOC143207401 [Lasioglossum baleicum]|uniref:uncharacterized protein LOC143207401 n=1 Tax=Lasioglossum baleicum TaxID=434251 RepID=UPI003FCE530F
MQKPVGRHGHVQKHTSVDTSRSKDGCERTVGFTYIIQKQKQQQICFGSGRLRDTTEKSPFMRYYTLEEHPSVSPNSYNALESFKAIKNKPCSRSISKRGYSGIARFAMQALKKNDHSSPIVYDTSVLPEQSSKVKQSYKCKTGSFPANSVPGPGMYVSAKGEGIRFAHNFGGRVKMELGVDLKCCSGKADVCKRCGKQIFDDYWHLKNKIFLCRLCMVEHERRNRCKKSSSKLFRKIRDCSIMHQHGATTAKTWSMHPKIVTQWIQRESYLSAYLKE